MPEKFCHPVPIEQHLNGMKLDRIWGTLIGSLLQLFTGVITAQRLNTKWSFICSAYTNHPPRADCL